MRVLEQVDPGVVVGAGMDQALDHPQQRPLSRVRVHARSRTVRIGHREELMTEATLAYTCLADHPDHHPAAVSCLLERRIERRELIPASNEPREAARA